MKNLSISAVLCGALGLAACQTVGQTPGTTPAPVDPNAVAQQSLAYLCPIAIGLETTVPLNGVETASVKAAVADCQSWQANPNAPLTSPAVVTTVVVQAVSILEQAGAFKHLGAAERASATKHLKHFKTVLHMS